MDPGYQQLPINTSKVAPHTGTREAAFGKVMHFPSGYIAVFIGWFVFADCKLCFYSK